MSTSKKGILIFLAQILFFQLYAQQVGIARFMDASIYDGIEPFEYQKIKFNWNMSGNVQLEMNEGLNSIDENRFLEAIAHLNQVLKLDPNFGPAYYYRSVCYKNQLNLSQAEYDMTKALSLLTLPECFIELGDISYLKKDFRLALKNYEKAVKADPKLVVAHYKLGCFSVNFLTVDEALKYFEKCTELDPSFVKAHFQLGIIHMRFKKNNEVASQFFTKAIRADSSNAQAYFWRGLLSLDKRLNNHALEDLNKTIELAPFNPFFRLIRGLLLTELKEFDKAYTDFRRALISTQVSEGKSQFGQTILDKKIDLQNACLYLDKVLYGYDEFSFEFMKMGFCYLIAGNYGGAIENFNRVLRLNESACATYLLALTYEHREQHNLAYNNYSRALELDSDIFDAHKKRAVYRVELKDWEGAFADLKEMRRIQPTSNVTYRLSGFINYHSGNYFGSVEDLNLYLKEDSIDVEALKVRADSRSKLKDYAGAISDFKVSISLSPEADKKDIEYMIIENTIQLGDTINAVKLLLEFNKTYDQLNSTIKLIEIYIESRDFKKAENNISMMEKAFKDSNRMNNMSFAFYLRSKLKSKRGQYIEALDLINKSLKLSELNEFLLQRAVVLFHLNQIEEGRKDLIALKKQGYKEAESYYSKYNIN